MVTVAEDQRDLQDEEPDRQLIEDHSLWEVGRSWYAGQSRKPNDKRLRWTFSTEARYPAEPRRQRLTECKRSLSIG